MMRLDGLKEPLNTVLLARVSDQLGVWLWANSDKNKRSAEPVSILDTLLGKAPKEAVPIHVFQTSEEFRAAYQTWIGGE